MAQDWRNDYTKSVVEYVKETNQFLGLTSFTIGLSCMGKPAYYAWFALVIIPFIWKSRFDSFKNRLAALRAGEHVAMQAGRLLIKCWPALAGWAFLSCVALKIVK